MPNNFARVREATGLTQPELARLLDVSRDTISGIEGDRLALSDKLAQRLYLRTGALPFSVREGEAPLGWDRSPYAPAHFAQWQVIMAGDLLAPDPSGHPSARFLAVLAVMLQASARHEKLGRVQAEIAFSALGNLFDDGSCMSAQDYAAAAGISEDFNKVATLCGRVLPASK